MQRENPDKSGTSVDDLVSEPIGKLRELAEAELDCVAGGTGGDPSNDRNLYIDAATYNGAAVAAGAH